MKLAWRETKSSWSRFLFLFLCMGLGVGAIVAVDLFAAAVERSILGDARALQGGDVEISSRRSFTKEAQSLIETLPNRGFSISHVTELTGMASVAASNPDQFPTSQLVEIKAIDPAYPLYGAVTVSPDHDWKSLLAERTTGCLSYPCFGTVVQEALLFRLRLQVGHQIHIGESQFTIMGILKKEPDQVANAFSLGPRILISRGALTATGLVKPGSRVHQRIRLKVPESYPLPALVGELRGRLAKEGVQVSSFQETQPRLRRFLEQLSLYLGLLSLTILLVGGIGVACTIQGFLAQKTANIATLKTLGADSTQVAGIYLTQCLLLGGIGSGLGGLLGIALFQVIPWVFADLLPPNFSPTFSWLPVLKGMAVGTVATVIFSLWPLLSIRHISPALIFRQAVEQVSIRTEAISWFGKIRRMSRNVLNDRLRNLIGTLIVISLTILAIRQARSFSLGIFFSGAFLTAIGTLMAGTRCLYWLLPRMPIPQRFLLRHSTKNLLRPGNFTRAMTLAIGLGVMLMTALFTIQQALLDFIGNQIPTKAPSFFFIDIQPDQQEQFEQILKQHVPDSPHTLVPVVRSRLLSINGKDIHPEEHKNQRNGWYFTREYVLTALATLPQDNVLTQGTWWGAKSPVTPVEQNGQGKTSHPLVSVEEDAAQNLGLSLGSIFTLDIQGVPLTAEVASIRKVDWGSFSMNFFMIFEPSALEGAPFTSIATARIPKTEEQTLQQAIVDAMPNVTAIHVGDILDNITRIFQQLATGIRSLALLCVITGALVMMAAISINRYRRLQELAILKAIGGTRFLLVGSLGIEFGLIGGFAGLLGLSLGALLSWAIVHFFFDLPWNIDLSFFAVGWWITVAGAVLTGLLGTYRLLGFPPLPILRQE
ncbi:MAG: ABC transporter permease [Nitrospirales bacterium]